MYWTDLYFKLKIIVPLVLFGCIGLAVAVGYVLDWVERRKGRPF